MPAPTTNFPLGTGLGAPVVPGNSASAYATHYDVFGAGGWRTVFSDAERNATPVDAAAGLHFDALGSGRRRIGMVVVVADNIDAPATWVPYRLEVPAGYLVLNDAAKVAALADNANWAVLSLGGGAAFDALKARVDAITAGANSSVDTFIEAYNRFLAEESAAASLNAQVALKAPLASPALTGTPTAPTAAERTSPAQLATNAYADRAADAAAIDGYNYTDQQLASIANVVNKRYVLSGNGGITYYGPGYPALRAAVASLVSGAGDTISLDPGGTYDSGIGLTFPNKTRILGNGFRFCCQEIGAGALFDRCEIENLNVILSSTGYGCAIKMSTCVWRSCRFEGASFTSVSAGGGANFNTINDFIDSANNSPIFYNGQRVALRGKSTLTNKRFATGENQGTFRLLILNKTVDANYYTNPAFNTIGNSGVDYIDVAERLIMNVYVTPSYNQTVIFGDLVNGSSGSILFTQDITGGRTLTANKRNASFNGIYDTANETTLASVNFQQPDPTPGKLTELNWIWNGSVMIWNNKVY